ncbi:hypothetical protein Pma05_77730 [Plantactinospora mayteni]|uniref:Uncharacterized protein n=1 Tax=Plantactinospora mayteni TaxID=566021 RepID=A0ABQ4F2Q9_9ACTN|nr:hypothetical protein Pma05_77730 [Plantactinospora mayteni]
MDVYGAPWSVCMIVPSRLPRVRRAATKGVDDQVGASVIGDRPAGEAPKVRIDDGGQVEEPALTDRQVRDVADVTLIHRWGG